MPIWLMMVPGILQGIATIFHKDDPSNPTVNPQQAPQMFFQQMMPFLMLMGNKDNDNSMLPILMMMQMMGVNPSQPGGATGMEATIKSMQDIQKQMADMQAMVDSLKKSQQ